MGLNFEPIGTGSRWQVAALTPSFGVTSGEVYCDGTYYDWDVQTYSSDSRARRKYEEFKRWDECIAVALYELVPALRGYDSDRTKRASR